MQRVTELAERARRLRHLNFLITETFELAERQWRQAEEAGRNPFVMVIKDNYAVKDVRLTCGSKMLKDFVSPYTATCVQRLLDNGGCLLGKSNLDEFAMGSTTTSSCFGPVLHSEYADQPDYAEGRPDFRIAGGSSGGCAVAVATGVADVAIGSDTGGSVRYPAALNGVYGFKPSYGRLSRHGLVPLANALDTPSIFARSVAECQRYYDILKGHDPMDSTSLPDGVDETTSRLFPLVEGLVIGIPEFRRLDLLSPDSRRVWYAAIAQLTGAGARTVSVSLPHAEHAIYCYSLVADADVPSNMARYDGIRFGDRDEDKEFGTYIEQITHSRTTTIGQNVKRRIFAGNFFALSQNFDKFVDRAQRVQRLIQRDFSRAFAHCDVLLTPVTRHSAPLLSEVRDRSREEQRLDDYFVVPANLAGVPAISVPFATCAKGLPLGVQLIAPYLQDSFLLSVAQLLPPMAPDHSIHTQFA